MAAPFDEAKVIRTRGIAKRKLSYILKFITEYNPENDSIEHVHKRLQSLPKILDEFEMSQDQLEINGENPETYYSEREEFMQEFHNVEVKLTEIINSSSKQLSHPESIHSNNSNALIKLPSINIPTFDGNVRSWIRYRDTFTSLVLNNNNLTVIQKFHYLISSLKGESKGLLDSLTITDDNFNVAWELLYERYNNNKVIAANHVKALLNLPHIKTGNSTEYRSLINEVTSNKRALESLKPAVPLHDVILVEAVLDKLRRQDRQEWEIKTASDKFNSLKQLVEFLEARAQALEIIDYRNNSNPVKEGKSKALVSKSLTASLDSENCKFCNGSNHSLQNCKRFKSANLEEKRDFLRNNKLCFMCLKGNHSFSKCRERCAICKAKHNQLLHVDHVSQDAVNEGCNVSSYTSVKDKCITNLSTLLPTFVADIEDKNGILIECRGLLDSGSQMSFISQKLVKRLGIPLTKTKFAVSGINGTHAASVIHTCTVIIKSKVNDAEFKLNCAVLENLTGPIPAAPVCFKYWNLPEGIKLADPVFHKPANVDLLLGADIFFNVVIGQAIKRFGYPTLLNTMFGYVLSGRMPQQSPPPKNAVSCLTRTDMLSNQLRKFWELEEVNFIPQTKEDKFCEQHFVENTTRTPEGRFMVRLPVRLEVMIGNSLELAKKRMSLLERKFETNKKLCHDYVKFMEEYANLGHMELCDTFHEHTEFCIPHHAVFKPTSSTTKLRVVFDGSAKSSNNYSLNDLLCVGPVIQEDLYSIVLRFRKHPIAMTADIAKMYRQILVDPRDRCLQKILWRSSKDQELKCYKLSTVTYGTSPASFLATRCLKQLADENEISCPTAAEVLRSDFYVDDYLGGAATVEDAISLRTQLVELLASAGVLLRKWSSSHEDVLCNVAPDQRERLPDCKLIGDQTVQTLGIAWHPLTDCFRPRLTMKPVVKLTKRNVLSSIASIFDPLGLLAPVVIKCKILMQRLWCLNLSWDEKLPLQVQNEWNKIYDNLHCLNDISVDRKIVSVANPKSIELHGFSDASEQAYGACLYLKCVADDGYVTVTLVTAKSRVAPVKQQSLPRLELCGALLLSRLLKKVIHSLKLNKLDKICLWCDSTIVLSWINTVPNKLKCFIANRVSEIQDITDIKCWHHVATVDNPADYVTRGVFPHQLQNLKRWWNGPKFLRDSDLMCTERIQILSHPMELPELKSSKNFLEDSMVLVLHLKPGNLNAILKKYSSLEKLKRVIAYVLRFVYNVRNAPAERRHDCLATEETNSAFVIILRLIQQEEYANEINCLQANKEIPPSSKLKALCPILDKDGLLRVGGRLEHSDLPYEAKHQVILPSKHHVTSLLIRKEHSELLHAGTQSVLASLRTKFWLPAGRSVVKKILRSCIICFKVNVPNNVQLMGQLPATRVRPAYPFEYTGVDYAGPVKVKMGLGRSKNVAKGYIAFFICFATKAVHLELVSALTTDAFLAALRRFIARRGKCREIMSDNGTNFVGAAAELKKFLRDTTVHNNLTDFVLNLGFFIPPRSPHFGGLWESGVKAMKAHLKKVIGDTILSFEEYSTLLAQVEACLNSRPLTPISDDPQALTTPTPGHFLIGRPLNCIPEPCLLSLPVGRLSRWQHLQRMTQHFWQRWSSEYLAELQRRSRWSRSRPNLAVGDLVLLKEDNIPPLQWKLGRVSEVLPGKDGVVRVAKVMTQAGEVLRASVKLCILPLNE